jgi:NAD+ synthase
MRVLQELIDIHDYKKVTDSICNYIIDQVKINKAKGLMLGISGGLDSAVLAFLGSRALGPEKIHGLFLPDRDTAPENYWFAEEVGTKAGFPIETIDMSPIFKDKGCYDNIIVKAARNRIVNRIGFQSYRRIMKKDLYEFNLTGTGNIIVKKAIESYYLRYRTRMDTLYEQSRKQGLLLPDSLNKTENLIGFTIYGDINVDFAPILPLYKSQVRALASYLGVPNDIIQKPPSPDLFPGITDEIFLDMKYDLLDSILFSYERGESEQVVATRCNTTIDKVRRIKHLKDLASLVNSQLNIPYPEI